MDTFTPIFYTKIWALPTFDSGRWLYYVFDKQKYGHLPTLWSLLGTKNGHENGLKTPKNG